MCQAVCDIDHSQPFSKQKEKEIKNFPLDCALSTTATFAFVSW